MSNFVHKVKDAMTDRDKPAASNTSENRHHGASNPFTPDYNQSQNAPRMNNTGGMGSNVNRSDSPGYGAGADPGPMQNDQRGEYPAKANTGMGNRGSGPRSDTHSSTTMPENTSSSGGSNDINAGPHRSSMAKLDPRVDSDQDNRAQQGAAAPQRSNAGAQGMNPSNMPGQQQPYNQGLDNHSSSEDNFNKSTQEHRSHNQPGQFDFDGNQVTGEEENYSTSTQEQKSHKNTSHISPCPPGTTGGGQKFENQAGQGFDNRAAQPTQPGLDSNQAAGGQPDFGGNAAGGSSYNENMSARGQDNTENAAPLQKSRAGADVNRPTEQQNTARDQRAGY